MVKALWITDPHLNFLELDERLSFIVSLKSYGADALFLTGDIGQADDFTHYLWEFQEELKIPVYFVLGNHDYYRGSIAFVRTNAQILTSETPNLIWMNSTAVVEMTSSTAIVGHDGWGDGRIGNALGTPIELNDFYLIEELTGLDRVSLLKKLHQLGDEAAAHIRQVLPQALENYKQVILLTHVSPFRESTWYRGRISSDDWQPFFTCRAVGEVLREVMNDRPENELLVLCGHTHSPGEAQILPNLKVLTGGAQYGEPRVQMVLNLKNGAYK
jgi:predicted MPP superfamily phosphohydrolase